MISLGISASSSSGSLACGVTPSATGTCLLMMMTPIAANRPCTADEGKKSPSDAGPEQAEQNLNTGRHHAHRQRHLVGRQIRGDRRGLRRGREAKVGHRARARSRSSRPPGP